MSFGPRVPVVPFPAWIAETLAIRGSVEAAAAPSPFTPPAQPPVTSFSTVPENASVSAPSRSKPWWVQHLRLGEQGGSHPAEHHIPDAAFEALARELQGMQHYRGSLRFPAPAPVALLPGTEVWVTKRIPSRDTSKPTPLGYARIAADADGQLFVANESCSAPLTREIVDVLAPVENLQQEAVEALPGSKGWKLHLNFDRERRENVYAIRELLERLKVFDIIDQFKIGNAEPGKEATVYIGHGSLARRVATFIQEHAAHLLLPPAGESLDFDVVLTPLVVGRFDIHPNSQDFIQYGFHGVPYLRQDAEDLWSSAKKDPEEKRRDAWRVLEYRYGTFFTDGFIGSARPK